MALPSRTSIGCKTGERDMSASMPNPPEFKHVEDMKWEMGRFGNVTKFLFHPRPERPTEPNAGFLKYAPGASFPLHRHDFAQVWYIIEGEFTFAGKLYGPGTIAYMADPHFEHDMHTATGGTIFFVQYPGPTTGAPPIYDGRMNLKEAPPLARQDLEH
jgi:anti-sigma factor ChrR (cupin superfamily)